MKKKKKFIYTQSNIDLVTVLSVLIFVGSVAMVAFALSEDHIPAAIAGGLLFGAGYHSLTKVLLLKKEEIIEEDE